MSGISKRVVWGTRGLHPGFPWFSSLSWFPWLSLIQITELLVCSCLSCLCRFRDFRSFSWRATHMQTTGLANYRFRNARKLAKQGGFCFTAKSEREKARKHEQICLVTAFGRGGGLSTGGPGVKCLCTVCGTQVTGVTEIVYVPSVYVPFLVPIKVLRINTQVLRGVPRHGSACSSTPGLGCSSVELSVLKRSFANTPCFLMVARLHSKFWHKRCWATQA